MEKKVLLFSGGFDSRLQEWLIKPDILLYVDMKTSYSDREIEALHRLPKHYTDRLIIKELPLGEYERDNKYLPYRNLILGTIAMEYGQHVYFGFNYNDTAPDKTSPFLTRINKLFEQLNMNCIGDMGWDNDNFSFEAPYINYTKTELVGECLEQGMPVEWIRTTRTCYSGLSDKGCGMCDPCLAKAIALLNNDIFVEGLFDREITIEALQRRYKDVTENTYNYKKKYGLEVARAIKKLRLLKK